MKPAETQTSLASPVSNGHTWLASRLLNRQVVNASTLEPVGRVADVAFDPESCLVTALCVQPEPSVGGFAASVGRRLSRRRAIASVGREHIISLNGDVVMVDSDPVRFMGHAARLRDVCELTILTLHGMCLGSLADLILDNYGSVVTGYVVNPTRHAEALLLPLEELEQPPRPQAEQVEQTGRVEGEDSVAADPSEESALPAANLRVIPASPRVRIGDSLILVVEEAEPLRQEPVVVSSQSGARTEDTAHHNGV